MQKSFVNARDFFNLGKNFLMRYLGLLLAITLFACSSNDSIQEQQLAEDPDLTGELELITWTLAEEYHNNVQQALSDCYLQETMFFAGGGFNAVYVDNDNPCDLDQINGNFTYNNTAYILTLVFVDGGETSVSFRVKELSSNRMVLEFTEQGTTFKRVWLATD